MGTNLPPDPYAALGVSNVASSDAIKKAYRTLARKLHPDRCVDETQKQSRVAEFTTIQQAYGIFGDEETRKRHDFRVRRAQSRQQNNVMPGDNGRRLHDYARAPASMGDSTSDRPRPIRRNAYIEPKAKWYEISATVNSVKSKPSATPEVAFTERKIAMTAAPVINSSRKSGQAGAVGPNDIQKYDVNWNDLAKQLVRLSRGSVTSSADTLVEEEDHRASDALNAEYQRGTLYASLVAKNMTSGEFKTQSIPIRTKRDDDDLHIAQGIFYIHTILCVELRQFLTENTSKARCPKFTSTIQMNTRVLVLPPSVRAIEWRRYQAPHSLISVGMLRN